MVSVAKLNGSDFYEYHRPIKVHQLKVPDGEFMFPMVDRYNRVRDGLAHDAIERPVVESLTNQDAEQADEPAGNGEAKVEVTKVIDPSTGALIDLPEGERYYDSGGTLGRRYGGSRGSKKPDSIPTHIWVNLSKKQKDKAISEEAAKVAREHHEGAEALGGGSSSSRPAAPIGTARDRWEIKGNKLIRYHCTPRRELFSPDIADCPVPLTRVKPTRLHQIIPVGTEDFIADEDEWTNPRRRNKKLSFRWVGKTIFEIMPLGTSVSNVNRELFPTMPTIPFKSEHREKLASYEFTKSELDMIMAMVARPVNKKELAENPDAQKSLDVEWDKLMNKKAWDMDHPREWAEVSAEAVRRGRKAHVGRVFEICVEKGSELPKGSPLRKFKGRGGPSHGLENSRTQW